MAISINWNTRVIYIPKSFLRTISATLYELDVNALRIALKDIEDSVEGLPHPDTHRHNSPVTLAGVTYVRSIEIINGYTITFEDGQYAIRCIGANHNIGDVRNLNQVSLIIGNAAGLIVYTQSVGGIGTVGEVADAVWGSLDFASHGVNSAGAKLNTAGNSGDPWATTNLATYPNGSAGKLMADSGTDLTTIKGYTDTLETSATAIAGYVDTLETSVGAIKAVTDTLPSAANIAAQVRVELTAEIAHLMALQNGLTEGQATMLLESYRLLGLDPTRPLVVTKTTRTAGMGIQQSITGDTNTTVVTRI